MRKQGLRKLVQSDDVNQMTPVTGLQAKPHQS